MRVAAHRRAWETPSPRSRPIAKLRLPGCHKKAWCGSESPESKRMSTTARFTTSPSATPTTTLWRTASSSQIAVCGLSGPTFISVTCGPSCAVGRSVVPHRAGWRRPFGRCKFDKKELAHILGEGPSYLRDRDLTTQSDLEYTEAGGLLTGADPECVSDHALSRGAEQCGTLGSGNHFMEVQVVDEVFDEKTAAVFGLEKDMVCVMIHSGSRGLGYQVCDDALLSLRDAPRKYGIDLPDRQLACAPVDMPKGRSTSPPCAPPPTSPGAIVSY